MFSILLIIHLVSLEDLKYVFKYDSPTTENNLSFKAELQNSIQSCTFFKETW